MSNHKINLELEQTDSGEWEAELEAYDGDETRTKIGTYDNLHEAMADLQTIAIFEIASAEARENAPDYK